MKPKLLQQGAEAKIYLQNNTILKSRTQKSYRHPSLDKKIRTRRTKSESKILTKAKSAGANVPKLILPTIDYRLPINSISIWNLLRATTSLKP
ncbi:Kae1-associated serine/threonine protein kinase [Candidatus Pacearchaeota archaeon]|nr:Kae1-associated serine/threonine protein kinase [Candidatus Pacearchaeota archaeon]